MEQQERPYQTIAERLLAEVADLYRRKPDIQALLGLSPVESGDAAGLLADVLASAATGQSDAARLRYHAMEAFKADAKSFGAALVDIETTARKNFEPGGLSATLLYSRGVHAVLAHRVAHFYWTTDERDLALALKAVFGRAFSTDIHPAARFGKGIWLDHGLGFVVGETAIIGDDVSIWHGVTLGSTLKDSGERRHPRLGSGVTVGADAVLLGGIDIGAGAVIAAGSVVLKDVEPGTTVAGVPAKGKPRTETSFKGI
ncbi:serine O-acetyltransferase [Rhizobium straminoryzae]|nr:serine O-acetyltransferase [Rhizobium straminoryzae]